MTGPARIVCLSAETAEVVRLLGATPQIVGLSVAGARAALLAGEGSVAPVVTDFVKADIPAIHALRPDLVLGFSDLQAAIAAELVRAGLEVHVFNQRSIAGIFAMVRTLGALLGAPERAAALVDALGDHVAATRARAARLHVRPRVVFEEWPDPLIVGIGWVSELIEAAGGVDCFAELAAQPAASARIVGHDEVLRRQPDLMVASWCGRPFDVRVVQARPGFAASVLARPGRVVAVDSDRLLAPGPTCLTLGLDALHAEIARVAAEVGHEPPPRG